MPARALSTATISFGQPLPAAAIRRAQEATLDCDLFLVLGSSLVVYPAAHMPVHAKRAGARLVIVNRTPTPQDAEADLLVSGSAGAVLADVAQRVASRLVTT